MVTGLPRTPDGWAKSAEQKSHVSGRKLANLRMEKRRLVKRMSVAC
ncbi:hypothetical protein RSSM_02249 [Rhodopirellula sallentina SM41]|uniref:Uncharacterized protein n=1 Tax=Rhodopirellula sallentina SM41 TaxID=1263870 RepID=M5UEM1_9BACT|nr:hypothetical protein RSSM_02249 [Rhodopirellula sallentina SM41]